MAKEKISFPCHKLCFFKERELRIYALRNYNCPLFSSRSARLCSDLVIILTSVIAAREEERSARLHDRTNVRYEFP